MRTEFSARHATNAPTPGVTVPRPHLEVRAASQLERNASAYAHMAEGDT